MVEDKGLFHGRTIYLDLNNNITVSIEKLVALYKLKFCTLKIELMFVFCYCDTHCRGSSHYADFGTSKKTELREI